MAAEKFLQHDAVGGMKEVQGVTIGGAPNADRIPSLDASGLFPLSMMPAGLGGDVAVIVASGTLSAGDFVNVFNDGGTVKVRKADASSIITQAHGYVIALVADAGNATVFFEGNNTAQAGLTGGTVFLSPSVAGRATNTVPSGSGEIVQKLGVAVSATQVNFEPTTPILLA